MQKMPAPLRFIEPMECKPVPWLPEGDGWQYAVELDGYRALAIKQHGEVSELDRTRTRLPGLRELPGRVSQLDRMPRIRTLHHKILS